MLKLFKAHRARLPKAAAKPARKPAARSPEAAAQGKAPAARPKEIGGPSGPEPTRYGDWERKGVCVDF